MGLRDAHLGQVLVLLALQQLEDVKAGFGLDRADDIAHARALDAAHEQLGVAVGGAQAQHAAVAAAVVGVGKLQRQRREVLAGAGAARHLVGARLKAGQLGGAAALGHGHQDHGQVQVDGGRRWRRSARG
ncbi:MAG: hypothetical protein V9G22_12040 [Ottowia sp.]